MTETHKKLKVLIVGGVAGGANAAARLRRLNENIEIIVFERGGYVSFANCGLPYHIGDEITDRAKLLLHTPKSLRERFNIDVRINTEVVSIDRESKKVTAVEKQGGKKYEETYDSLILATGAAPFRPDIEGLDLPGIFSLRTIEDMDAIMASLHSNFPRHILIVGGGFIGLEMLEQLHSKFANVQTKLTLVEMNAHILSPLDSEMVSQLEEHIREKGIELLTGDAITVFKKGASNITALTKAGREINADFVLFNVGVRPETSLAKNSGLQLGQKGGMQVDSRLRTSDPNIFAIGDCIETINPVTGEYGITPLAGPANRQGRIVADVIHGIDSEYKGTYGTAIVRAFDYTAAVTGVNEKTLKRLGLPYKSFYLHPQSHASYYPGANPIHLKVIFSSDTLKILGAQAVGKDGVDKRIDVIATAIYAGLKVGELSNLELSYAPPFGSAKDPVNLAGMIAENISENLVQTISPLELEGLSGKVTLLDVRSGGEREKGFIPGSLHIPLNEVRNRLAEIPKELPLVVYCHSGQRSYNACRILMQHGFSCKNLTGAYATWSKVPRKGTF